LDYPSLSQWIQLNPFCTSYVSYGAYSANWLVVHTRSF
jgi:hypothetical protein